MQVNVGGVDFDLKQEFIDKYPQSIFAECLNRIDRQDGERAFIDRSSKYFTKILEYCRDRYATNISQMSHIDIRKLLIEAKYFKIESLIKECEYELTVFHQASFDIVETEGELNELLANECRLVIIVDHLCLSFWEGQDVKNALRVIDRDRCLIVARMCEFKGDRVRNYNIGNDKTYLFRHMLYDPKSGSVLRYVEPTTDNSGRLLALLHYSETFTEDLLESVAFIK